MDKNIYNYILIIQSVTGNQRQRGALEAPPPPPRPALGCLGPLCWRLAVVVAVVVLLVLLLVLQLFVLMGWVFLSGDDGAAAPYLL